MLYSPSSVHVKLCLFDVEVISVGYLQQKQCGWRKNRFPFDTMIYYPHSEESKTD